MISAISTHSPLCFLYLLPSLPPPLASPFAFPNQPLCLLLLPAFPTHISSLLPLPICLTCWPSLAFQLHSSLPAAHTTVMWRYRTPSHYASCRQRLLPNLKECWYSCCAESGLQSHHEQIDFTKWQWWPIQSSLNSNTSINHFCFLLFSALFGLVSFSKISPWHSWFAAVIIYGK